MVTQMTFVQLKTLAQVADYAPPQRAWDFKHSDLLGKVFIVQGLKQINTSFGDAYLADVILPEGTAKVLMGGQVLIEQLKALSEHLPAVCIVRKPGRAFVLDTPNDDELNAFVNAQTVNS
jgi:hypothetical protein